MALVGALYLVRLGVAFAKGHLRGALPSLGVFRCSSPALSLPLPCSAPELARESRRSACCLLAAVLTFDLSLNNAPNQSTGAAAADL